MAKCWLCGIRVEDPARSVAGPECPECAAWGNGRSYWPPPEWSEQMWARTTMPGRATGHLVGWRHWNVCKYDDTGALLLSVVGGGFGRAMAWEPGVPKIGEETPERFGFGRGAGVYAFRSPFQLPRSRIFHDGNPFHGLGCPFGSVFGRVALWGEVVVHSLGYRARYAYPVELWSVGLQADLAEDIMDLYDVPVHTEAVPNRLMKWTCDKRVQLVKPQREG